MISTGTMMFLPPDKVSIVDLCVSASSSTLTRIIENIQWSPRFGEQFYTVRIARYLKCETPPTNDSFASDECSCLSPGRNRPAVYYEIAIQWGNSSCSVYRRYSQFHYLRKKLDHTGSLGLVLPSKTSLFHEDTDEFLNTRLEELYSFLLKALVLRECSGNALVERFLGLSE